MMNSEEMEAGFDLDMLATSAIRDWVDTRAFSTQYDPRSSSHRPAMIDRGLTLYAASGSRRNETLKISLYVPGASEPGGGYSTTMIGNFQPSRFEEHAAILAQAAGIEVDGRTPLQVAREVASRG